MFLEIIKPEKIWKNIKDGDDVTKYLGAPEEISRPENRFIDANLGSTLLLKIQEIYFKLGDHKNLSDLIYTNYGNRLVTISKN